MLMLRLMPFIRIRISDRRGNRSENHSEIASSICVYTNDNISVEKLIGGRRMANKLYQMTPKEIVGELDKYIIGQDEGKEICGDRFEKQIQEEVCSQKR